MDKSIHSDNYKLLINLLKEERIAKNITQKQLASQLSIGQNIISKIETYERRIDYIELRQICLALGTPVLDFITKFENKISNP